MKKILSIFIAAAMFFSLAQFALAASPYAPQHEREAQILYDYGMLAGTDKGLELDKPLTRLEGAVMIARLLGKEQEIKDGKYSQMEHPFKDVPTWGNEYVKFMYGNKITAGTGKTTFGSSDKMTAVQYTTFLLRVLGYDDSKGDFKWDESLDKAWKINMVGYYDAIDIQKNDFLRDQMAFLTLHALNQRPKGENESLLYKLASQGVIVIDKSEETTPIKDRVITSGLSFYRPESSVVTVIVDRDGLPDNMQDYVYFAVMSGEKGSSIDPYLSESTLKDFKTRTLSQGSIINASASTERQLFVFLFDGNQDLIGYYTVESSDIIEGSAPINQ